MKNDQYRISKVLQIVFFLDVLVNTILRMKSRPQNLDMLTHKMTQPTMSSMQPSMSTQIWRHLILTSC